MEMTFHAYHADMKSWQECPDVFFPSPSPVFFRAREKYGWLARLHTCVVPRPFFAGEENHTVGACAWNYPDFG